MQDANSPHPSALHPNGTFDKLKSAGLSILFLIGAGFTLLQIHDSGYSKGKSETQTLIDTYKLRQEDAEKATKVAQQEITSLKLELQRAVETVTPREKSAPDLAFIGKTLAEQSTRGISLSLSAGKTISPFDDGLYISLERIDYLPPIHVATLTFGHTGKNNLRVENLAVGSITQYEGYEIRVVATSTFSIGLKVEKMKA
ncbi:hypothetical protein QFA96_12850 [Pseudomonas sp. Ap32]|uniref:hypothetical protein n=1 Tax=Pseudomonas monteilii TaxID=76759 RepID=UPI0018AC3963|nr:hypothetical protein [Pseudomonas monteilii]MBF8748065.1 hypothetical protein [Pseudomonas monteilii]WHH52945.1 hypothetical protein QFA96_12850 [Pseudomonas sp. Ap32]HEK1011269.1 hypothetical protein [Pseudomonas putida]